MNKLQVGNVVLLKSGGPLMTIQNLGDYTISSGIENGAFCVWFVNAARKEAVFHIDGLQLYDEDGDA
jgi:uncharacterized protein YodC (DUF2158 family)